MQTKLSLEDRISLLGVVFIIIGPILLSFSVTRALDTGAYADLTARAPIVDAECGPAAGGYVFINVDGARRACSAGGKCPADKGEAAYDPADPSRCRAAANLDGLGGYERAAWVVSTNFCLFGLFGVWLLLRRRRKRRAMFEAEMQ